MTYVDGWMHRRLVEEGARYPTNAIMTHGIIDGVLNRLGGTDEGLLGDIARLLRVAHNEGQPLHKPLLVIAEGIVKRRDTRRRDGH